MKLNTLTMKNFLGWPDAVVEFAAVTFILGQNGEGKSAVRDAIQFALTGTCRNLKFKNQSRSLSSATDGRLQVVLETDSGVYAQSQSPGGKGPVDPEVVAAVVDMWSIVRMSDADRQKFATRHLLPKPPAAPTLGFDPGRSFINVVQLLAAGDVDKAYGDTVDLRRHFKRTLKEMEAQPELPPATITIGENTIDLTTVDDRWRTKYRELTEEAGKWKARAEQSDPETLLAKQSELEAATRRYAAVSQEMTETDATFAQLRDRSRMVSEEWAETRSQLGTLQSLQINANEVYRRMAAMDGHCVISDKIVCPLGSNDIGSIMANAKARADDLTGKIAPVEGRLREQAREKDRLARELEEIQAKFNRDSTAYISAGQTVEHLKFEVERAEKLAEGRDEFENRAAAASDRAARVQAVLDAADRYRRMSDELAGIAARRSQIQADLTTAEKVCEILGPDGPVRAQAAESAESLTWDAVADPWGMNSLTLQRDGQLLLHGRPIALASQSEQYRAGALLALRLAEQTDFVVLDEFDLLDRECQMAFMRRVPLLKDAISSIVLCSTYNDRPRPSENTWIRKYYINQRQLERV